MRCDIPLRRLLGVNFFIYGIAAMTIATAISRSIAGESNAEPLKLDFSKVSLADPAGKSHSLADLHKKSTVLFFLGTECPVANGYLPTMKLFAEKYGTLDVRVVGVHSDPSVDAKSAKRHQEEYKVTFPILLDSEQRLADMVGAERMGQVVLICDGTIRYRGRIDDRYSDTGKRRNEPGKHDLQVAVDAVINGNDVIPTETKAFGCPLPKLKK